MRVLLVAVFVVVAVPDARAQGDGVWPWAADVEWHDAVAWDSRNDVEVDDADTLRVAAAELRIGRADRALRMLDGFRPRQRDVAAQRDALEAAAREMTGNDSAAAILYERAGRAAPPEVSGILLARAGAVWERLGVRARALRAYLGAADRLPAAAPWFRLRAAGVAPTPAAAESLLTGAPPAGHRRAQAVRAMVWLSTGDTAAAIDGLTAAGDFIPAARLALAMGDTADARTLAYRGLRAARREHRQDALDLVEDVLPPGTAAEYLEVARAWAALRDMGRAVRYGRRAVDAGDTTAATALRLGDWLERNGERRAALDVYARGGIDGRYLHARALLRLGRRSEAARAFQAFADAHPDHRWAPLALFLAADVRSSDSLYQAVVDRWPDHTFASRARFRLAARALLRGDTSSAMTLYGAEVQADGDEGRRARYLVSRLRLAVGEREAARAGFAALAHDDSVGYYGTIARVAVAMDPPVFDPPPVRTPSPSVQQALRTIDLLDAAGFVEEVEQEIGALMDREWVDADELLDFAEGLIVRGRGPEGIRLGWRATRDLSLNHPRVIRVIFPWPNRALIEREARKFDIDPYLLAGLIRQESSFQAHATSRAGARGFMQLMPATARGVARRLRVPWNETMFEVADANVHIGAAHLAGLLRQFDGNIVAALAAYNAGGSRARRWLRAPQAADPAYFVERIPFQETRGYVRAVIRNQALYRALYGPRD